MLTSAKLSYKFGYFPSLTIFINGSAYFLGGHLASSASTKGLHKLIYPEIMPIFLTLYKLYLYHHNGKQLLASVILGT